MHCTNTNCRHVNAAHHKFFRQVLYKDYIAPGSCTDTKFRTIWVEFESENKVTVNTPVTSFREYMDYIAETTITKFLSAGGVLASECGCWAAHFCGHSIFGKDVFVSISIKN
uniref:Coatomer_b_Cpla domain-containing protein n=1 Tax=Panagrellus redivivus TaxID=6233 RepID=A0A7E4UVW9_PANRE